MARSSKLPELSMTNGSASTRFLAYALFLARPFEAVAIPMRQTQVARLACTSSGVGNDMIDHRLLAGGHHVAANTTDAPSRLPLGHQRGPHGLWDVPTPLPILHLLPMARPVVLLLQSA